MKPRTLLVLTLLVVGLGAFLWFVERDLPSSDERAERSERLFTLEADEVDAVVVQRVAGEPGAEPIRLEREPEPESESESESETDAEAAAEGEDEAGDEVMAPFPAERGWRLVAPVEDRADTAAVSRLLSTVLSLRKQRTVVPDGVEITRAQLGLEAPRATLILEHGGQRTVLQVGAQLPSSDSTLVAFEGDDEAHVVSGNFVADLLRDAEAWRHREPEPEDPLGGPLDGVEGFPMPPERGSQLP